MSASAVLVANIGRPLPARRRLLMEVANSIMLYGSEIWSETLEVQKRASSLVSVQRTAAYCTMSAPAVLVANIGGPLSARRTLLMEMANRIMLYGSEIWAETLEVKKREKSLVSVQRTAAYCTVSASVVLVVNIGGPLSARRSLVMEVPNSTMIQGSEIWSGQTHLYQCKEQLHIVQSPP